MYEKEEFDEADSGDGNGIWLFEGPSRYVGGPLSVVEIKRQGGVAECCGWSS